ncbi:MAG: BlaI/MecI/CopY family transcriptional regulator [Candidatus Hydrogenedentota bacterium]
MNKKQSEQLSKLEMSVMKVVWELGECTSRQVIERYCQDRNLADTTLRTVLANLRTKGFVTVLPSTSRELLYAPAVEKNEVKKSVMLEMLGNLFDGSPKHAILHMIESETVDDDELAEIEKLIENYRKKKDRK